MLKLVWSSFFPALFVLFADINSVMYMYASLLYAVMQKVHKNETKQVEENNMVMRNSWEMVWPWLGGIAGR